MKKRNKKQSGKKATNSHVNEVVLENQKGLSLVLNGGNEIKNATFPVRWFFSPEIAEQKPEYIVLVDLTEKQFTDSSGRLRNTSGRRYCYAIDEALVFLQTRKAGKHTLLALAFDNRESAISFLESSGHYYRYEIDLESILAGKNWSGSIATSFVEFTVPEECFAKPPQSKLGELWWKFLFWPNFPKAIDECQIRKLSWFYTPPKLIFFIVFTILMSIIGSINYLRVLLAIPIFKFFGYSIHPFSKIREELKKSFSFYGGRIYYPVNIINGYRLEIRDGYKIIGKRKFAPSDVFSFCLLLAYLVATVLSLIFFYTNEINGFLGALAISSSLFSPIFFFRFMLSGRVFKVNNLTSLISFIPLFAFSIFFLFSLFNIKNVYGINPSNNIDIIIPILFFVVSLYFIIISIKKIIKFNKNRKIEMGIVNPEEKQKLAYDEYLKSNFVDSKNSEVPKKTFWTNKWKRDGRILFWRAKAQVCRPYEED